MARLVLVALIVVGGGLAYLWFAGGSGEPTTQLTTPPLAAATTVASGQGQSGETTIAGVSGAELTFVVGADDSQARFELDEELRGSAEHVVGTTSEVAGQVRFDPADLSTAAVSQIVVNARTFTTGSSNRDRAIRGPVVLNSASDEFELITFDPTSLDGLPVTVTVGDVLTFTMTGDLTINGTTNPVTFDVEVTWVEDGRLEGVAETIVNRNDFGIGIPNAPGVANVTEEVLLALEFAVTST